MSKKHTLFGLDPKKISNLLEVCSEKDSNTNINPEKTEALQDRLSATLPVNSLTNPLSKELTHLCCISGIIAGDPIRSLLLNPKTDIELIRNIKEHGKILSQNASNAVEHDIANAIYYAAIAHALVYHNLKITIFSYDELEKSLTIFMQTEWISTDLVDLFSKAVKYCHDQLNKIREGDKGE